MRLLLAATALLLTASATARAAEREASLEHAGSLGVLVNTGPELAYALLSECLTCDRREALNTAALTLELGFTVSPGREGDELLVRGRLFRLARPGEMLLVGYRSYFGRDEWKTYAELDLQATLRPMLAFGARPALGVMYELSPLIGVAVETGISFGVGAGFRVGVEALVGIQGRTYLLE